MIGSGTALPQAQILFLSSCIFYTTLAHPVGSVLIKLRGFIPKNTLKYLNSRAYYFKGVKLCRLVAKTNTRFQPDAPIY
jgi:hypothetical protein